MDYDYRQIDRWENGHAYTSDGVLLLPTLHVTPNRILPDHILNAMAKGICGVCGVSNCRFEKTSPYKKMLSAYQSGKLELMFIIYWRSFGGLYKMMKPKIEQDLNEIKKQEAEEIKGSVKFAADFYKEAFNTYGEKAEKLAKAMAEQAKGKKIRNVEDALKAYNKYSNNISRKIDAKDRKAITAALESVKTEDIAKNFKKFSKGMLYTSRAINFIDWSNELIKAIDTNNWRPFFVKTETIAAGMAATALAGFAFSALLGEPIGILGYGLIIAGIGALINDSLVEEANNLIGI